MKKINLIMSLLKNKIFRKSVILSSRFVIPQSETHVGYAPRGLVRARPPDILADAIPVVGAADVACLRQVPAVIVAYATCQRYFLLRLT